MRFVQFIAKACSYLGWVFFVIFAVPTFIVLAVLVVAFSSGGGDEDVVSVVTSANKGKTIGVIELTGEITDSMEFSKLISKASRNDSYKGLVVRVDTPGGSVGASEEIYRAIKEADTHKPVVCSLGNLAASGGLYAAVGCRKIVANRGTLSGSIGVIMMMPNFQEIMDKFGFRMNVIKSGQFKDSGSPFRTNTEADKQILQAVVDKAYRQFVDVVATSRGLEPEAVKRFADGRIIIGEEAKQLGIVDEFGGVQEAARLAFSLAGEVGEPEIAPVKKKDNLKELLEGFRLSAILPVFKQYASPQLLYRAEF